LGEISGQAPPSTVSDTLPLPETVTGMVSPAVAVVGQETANGTAAVPALTAVVVVAMITRFTFSIVKVTVVPPATSGAIQPTVASPAPGYARPPVSGKYPSDAVIVAPGPPPTAVILAYSPAPIAAGA
jgi:hypothetical protein